MTNFDLMKSKLCQIWQILILKSQNLIKFWASNPKFALKPNNLTDFDLEKAKLWLLLTRKRVTLTNFDFQTQNLDKKSHKNCPSHYTMIHLFQFNNTGTLHLTACNHRHSYPTHFQHHSTSIITVIQRIRLIGIDCWLSYGNFIHFCNLLPACSNVANWFITGPSKPLACVS